MVGYREGERRSEGLETRDTLIVRDTFINTILKDTTITKFVPRKIELIKRDTILRDTVLTYERKEYVDTVVNDADSIVLSNTILGIDARLDSTHISWKKHKEVFTNYVYINKEKPRKFWDRFHIQPQATAGYDIINHQWGICGGIGVGFDL